MLCTVVYECRPWYLDFFFTSGQLVAQFVWISRYYESHCIDIIHFKTNCTEITQGWIDLCAQQRFYCEKKRKI